MNMQRIVDSILVELEPKISYWLTCRGLSSSVRRQTRTAITAEVFHQIRPLISASYKILIRTRKK